jgi:hypothetical protein
MYRTLFCLCIMIVSFAANTRAVNGVAVSVAWRYADYNWGAFYSACPDQNMYDFTERGSIVRFTIAGASITCDTIHSRANGFAQCPAMNLAGTKVAFYRYGRRLGKSPTSGKDTLLDQSLPSHISLININGAGLVDLCQIRATPGWYCSIDWPAGDWIYYLNPRTGDHSSNDIGRVNAVTGANEPAYLSLNDGENPMPANSYVGRFNLSLKADRTGITCYNFAAKQSGIYVFPMTNGNVTCSGCFVGSIGACNPAVSASGGYTSGYGGGWHETVEIGKLPGGTGPVPDFSGLAVTWGITISDVATWTNAFGGANPLGADIIRWAVNSDKWVLQQYGWHGEADNLRYGTNQVMIDWVDRQAVVPSRNPNIPMDPGAGGSGVIFYGNCPGDFWVDGGASNAGKCEGADGIWRAVGTQTLAPSAVAAIERSPIAVRTVPDGIMVLLPARAGMVTVVDARGRSVFAVRASGPMLVPREMLARGSYMVSARSGSMEYSRQVTVQ